MSLRSYFVFGSILVYCVLIYYFFRLRDNSNRYDDSSCDSGLCLRFCCKNDPCDQKYINDSFDLKRDLAVEKRQWFYHKTVTGLFGKPNCTLKVLENDEEWDFSWDGTVDYDDDFYSQSKYCLQDFINGSGISWRLLICDNGKETHKMLHFILLPTSVLFLSLTIFIFIYVKELRDSVHGKCVLCLLVTMLISYISFPFGVHEWIRDLRDVMFLFSFLGVTLSGAWSDVLSYMMWNKIRHFDDEQKHVTFKTCCKYGFGLGFFIPMMFMAIESRMRSFSTIVVIFGVLASFPITVVVFTIMTGIKIFEKMKNSQYFSNQSFLQEKSRFWTTVEVQAIMMIVFTGEMFSMAHSRRYLGSYDSLIILDVIKCFSAFLIFGLFATTKGTKQLLQKTFDFNYLNI